LYFNLIVIDMGKLGWPEILLIVAVLLLLFGGKKIPELMKGLGRGVKEFKDGMNNPDGDKNPETKETDKP
jgi:sec-independent protein translocase protein TatA